MSVAVIFPGQGSQAVGMGADLKSDLFLKADEKLGYSLSKIMFEGPEDLLKSTENTQPALLTHSIALWNNIKDKISPDYFAGHSLGEYTAITAAGGMDFEEAVIAVHNRGKFMQTAVPLGIGGMTAVLGSDNNTVEEVCKEVSEPESIVEPANYNSDAQIVVAGHLAALERFAEAMKNKKFKRIVPLPVSAPFHCSLMKPAQINMQEYLNGVKINTLSKPVINNIDAELETEPDIIRNALVRQMSGSVKWTQSVNKLINMGVDKFIEVGQGSVLTGLIKKINKNVECINISSLADCEKL